MPDGVMPMALPSVRQSSGRDTRQTLAMLADGSAEVSVMMTALCPRNKALARKVRTSAAAALAVEEKRALSRLDDKDTVARETMSPIMASVTSTSSKENPVLLHPMAFASSSLPVAELHRNVGIQALPANRIVGPIGDDFRAGLDTTII